jgi:hypothetical protein
VRSMTSHWEGAALPRLGILPSTGSRAQHAVAETAGSPSQEAPAPGASVARASQATDPLSKGGCPCASTHCEHNTLFCGGLCAGVVSGIIRSESVGRGVKKGEALIRMEWEIRASREPPYGAASTGRGEYKGNKLPCQATKTSVCLYLLNEPKGMESIDTIRRWEERPLHTFHVLPSGCESFGAGIAWGDDAAGVRLYLQAQGIASDESAKALAGVAQAGAYRSQQA